MSDLTAPKKLHPAAWYEPVRITSQVKQFGFFIPSRAGAPPALSLILEDEVFIVSLGGDDPFKCYPMRGGSSHSGALVRDLEFRVDPASRFDARSVGDELGALNLQEGRATISVLSAGDPFRDINRVEVWGDFPALSPDTPISFRHWMLCKRDGEELVAIFEHDGARPS